MIHDTPELQLHQGNLRQKNEGSVMTDLFMWWPRVSARWHRGTICQWCMLFCQWCKSFMTCYLRISHADLSKSWYAAAHLLSLQTGNLSEYCGQHSQSKSLHWIFDLLIFFVYEENLLTVYGWESCPLLLPSTKVKAVGYLPWHLAHAVLNYDVICENSMIIYSSIS